MPERTPEEILKSVEQASVDEEIERVLSMTEEERRVELRAAGYDPKEPYAVAAAVREMPPRPSVESGANPSEKGKAAPSLRPLPRPRTLLLLAAALSGGVSLAVSIPTAIVIAERSVPPESAPAHPVPAAPQSALAPGPDVTEVRRNALEACNAGRWVECLYGLDLAQRDDPAGDADARVQLARREAVAGLLMREAPRPDVDSKAPRKR